MIVLGIDPGYALMGWGVVEAQGARMRLLGYGCVETQAGVPMQHRLRALQLGVRDLVNIYHPDDVAFEELFFARNVTTALMVGAARGAAIISAAEYTESLYEYTPMQIKQAVTGYGKADKKQIQQMVKLLLGMKEIPKPDDAADAIACAITHCQCGAAIISAAEYTESLYEYTPMQIKQAVTGYGKADKKQIQQMVKLLLGMKEIPKPDDAADAIACAITHCQCGAAKEQFRMK